MKGFWNVFTFEIRYRLARPATYAYFGMVFGISVLLFGGGYTPASDTVYHNSPLVIASLQVNISLFGILLASAIMGFSWPTGIYRCVLAVFIFLLFSGTD